MVSWGHTTNAPRGQIGTTMTKAHAKSLMERIDRMRNLINAATKPEEQGEMAKISAEEFDYQFMCMEQIIERASETPEEREARLEREDGAAQRNEDDAAYYRSLRHSGYDPY